MTWLSERTNNPDGILITFPAALLKEYPGGEKMIRRVLERSCGEEQIVWGNTISALPKLPVIYCYVCFLGFIQYRLNIVQFRANETRSYDDGGIIREFEDKNWVDLGGPVIKAPEGEFPKKGFQGFRYIQKIF